MPPTKRDWNVAACAYKHSADVHQILTERKSTRKPVLYIKVVQAHIDQVAPMCPRYDTIRQIARLTKVLLGRPKNTSWNEVKALDA